MFYYVYLSKAILIQWRMRPCHLELAHVCGESDKGAGSLRAGPGIIEMIEYGKTHVFSSTEISNHSSDTEVKHLVSLFR